MTGTDLMMRNAEIAKTLGPRIARATAAVVPWMTRIEEHPSWDVLAQLRVTMRAGVMLPHFKVSDLLALKAGQVFASNSPSTEDVPLMVGQVQLGWSEFEVQEQQMALRLTRLG